MSILIIIGLIYLAFHFGAGHAHHRYRRAHGLDPHLFWSLTRGPYGSIRLPGGFRIGHRL